VRTSKLTIWLQWLFLVNIPLVAVTLAPSVEAHRQGVIRFSAIDALLFVLALFILVSPLIVEYLLHRRLQVVDVTQILLLTGVGGASAVSLMGLLPFSLGGGSRGHVYGWVAVSVICILIYSWRYRRALA